VNGANKKLGTIAITGTPATVYTSPLSTRTKLAQIDVCNTTAADITLNVYMIASGGSAATSNALFYGLNIPANGALQWTGEEYMEPSSFIQASASTTGLTAHFSGQVDV
jgi:hypothetical protein